MLRVWGHSYANGAGASTVSDRWADVAAGLLGTTADVRYRPEVARDGGWCDVLQQIPGSGNFAAPTDQFAVMWGINDLTYQSDAGVGVFQNVARALSVVAARMRAGAVFEDTHQSFSWGAGWQTLSSTVQNSGTGLRWTTGPASYAITTPATFPGGTINIGVWTQTYAGNGATHTATIDGNVTAVAVYSVADITSTVAGLLRIEHVPAGSHVIHVTVSGVNTITGVDYWSWECPTRCGPTVVLVKQPLCPDYSAYVLPVVTDADVLVLNTIIDSVADLFGPMVRVADSHLATMEHDLAYFAADKLHPNDAGHALIAEAVVSAMGAA